MGTLNSPSPQSGASGGAGFGPSQLAGQQDQDASQDQGQSSTIGQDPNAQSQQLQATVQQFMAMEQTVSGMAQQFPSAAPELRKVSDDLKAALQRVIASPANGQEPPAPNSLA